MAMAVLSSSQHHQPLRHCLSLHSRFRKPDQRTRGLAYPLDTRIRPNRCMLCANLDESLRIFIERCHLTLPMSSTSRGLMHGQAGKTDARLAIRAHAKNSDHCDADLESAEWISNALHDPMVEVDPVTIGNQMLAEKQSRPLEISTTVVDSSPPVSQRLVRLRHIAVASAIAVFLLAVVAILQYLRSRNSGERRPLKKGVDLATSASEPSGGEMGSVKESIGASEDAIAGFSVAAAGYAAAAGDRIGQDVENFQSALQEAALKKKPAHGWPQQIDFPKGFTTIDESKPSSYSQDLTGRMNLNEEWNSHDGNGSSQGLVDKTEIDELVDHSLSKVDQANASLAQKLSEISDSKVFIDTPETGFIKELTFVEEDRFDESSSHRDEGDVQGPSSSQSDFAESAKFVHTSQSSIQNGGLHTTDPLSMEGKPPVELHPNPSFWSPSDAAGSNSGSHSTLGVSSYDLQMPSKIAFEPRADDLTVLGTPESELPPFESVEMAKARALQLERENSIKALEQALPALFVTIGTVGILWGVAGGLKVVGFAAATQLISQDLFWAESREAFWQELRKVTDRQKLRDFLSKRKAIKDD